MAGVPTNRTNINLPVDVSKEIIQKVQEGSAIMKLARKINLPGRGAAIPVVTSDPTPAWVGETSKKPVSNPGLDTKIMRGYTLSVIVPFSNQFRRDAGALYDELIKRLPGALGRAFDNTVFGGTQAPGSDFDTLASVTGQDIETDTYQGLVAAQGDIAVNGGILNGIVLSPQGQGLLLGATDTTKRPLFINSVAEGAVPRVLGAPTEISKAAYITGGTKDIVGFAGDWSQAMYGIVEGVDVAYSSDATLDDGNGGTINLFQQNMFAVRAEIEVGFVCDATVFNALTKA